MKKILLKPDDVLKDMAYFTFKGHYQSSFSSADTVQLTDGTPILLSRTGYTGEFGFEIFVDPIPLVNVWEMLLESGEELGLTPCGLAARDSLRAGAGLPLSHQDIGPWPFINHPWHFALPFNSAETHFTKPFIGDKSLLNITNPEYTYPIAGDNVYKVCSADQSVVLDAAENVIGSVLTCVTDMGIGHYKDNIYSITNPDKPEGGLHKTPKTIRNRIVVRLRALLLACNTIPFLSFIQLYYLSAPEVHNVADALQEIRAAILTNSIFFIVVGFIITMFVHMNFDAPIREIIQAFKDIRRGNFDCKVPVRSNDEIGYTGDVINEMTKGLKERDRLRHSLFLAKEIQQNLLPGSEPHVDGLDISGRSIYCDETGGDYYDFLDIAKILHESEARPTCWVVAKNETQRVKINRFRKRPLLGFAFRNSTGNM